MKYCLALALMFLLPSIVYGQKKATTRTRIKLKSAATSVKPLSIARLDVKHIPRDIHYTGKIQNAVRWKDKMGDNIVITTETGAYDSRKSLTEEGRSAELYAQHYLVQKEKSEQDWKVSNHIKDCPLDIQVSFIRNTFQVTDLDKDGIGEVWLMYKTACHGDVSPCDMKIIMYEGRQKYAVRGTNKVKLSETEIYGGEYKPDEALSKGPRPFRDFAQKLWQKNELEIWYNE